MADDYEMTSRNPRLAALIERAAALAATDEHVAIVGEAGVGKEHLARFLHARSDRRHQRARSS